MMAGESALRWTDQGSLGRATGMVVPAYFSAGPQDDLVRHLLWMTLCDCAAYVPLANVWVVVDGDARTARIAAGVQQDLRHEHDDSLNLIYLPENQGKFGALRAGVTALLAARPGVQWIVVRDGDGDHVAPVIPQLVRTAEFLARERGDTRVLIVGARSSRHRPMGFWRGELEALLDGLTLDALAFALARQGRPLDQRFLRWEGVPDLSSGYKAYGRLLAEQLFGRCEPRYLTLSPSDYWHYGPETVTVVEAVEAGAALAEVMRPAWDGQPTSSFGEFKLLALYGELLAWVWARLAVPLAVAAVHFDSRARGTLLRTIDGGSALVASLRMHALQKVRDHRASSETWPDAGPALPFV
jgi:hypothetical protein